MGKFSSSNSYLTTDFTGPAFRRVLFFLNKRERRHRDFALRAQPDTGFQAVSVRTAK